MDSTIAQPNLVVVGAATRVGSEVARLGVAYGATVYGTSPDALPPNDEPWTKGVAWTADSTDTIAWATTFERRAATALVVIGADEVPMALAHALAVDFDPERIIVVVEEGKTPAFEAPEASQLVLASHRRVIGGPVEPDQDTADAESIHAERLAMAVLRLALDESAESELDHEALCELGDAVFWA